MPLKQAPYLALIKDTSFFSPSHRDIWTRTEFSEIISQNPEITWALLIQVNTGVIVDAYYASKE